MSASHIPNLNTLRRGGPRGRGRGRGGLSNATENPLQQSTVAKDEVVQKTDTDAATSRLSAVEAGYLDDPFANSLTPGQHTRRLPLMNRGTYARTTAIDRVVDTFLHASSPPSEGEYFGIKQIISLGAGSDTRYFRLRQKHPDVDLIYHELDFPSNTKAKIALLSSSSFVETAKRLCNLDLLSTDVQVTEDGAGLSSPGYYVHPQDLRKIPSDGAALPGVDATVPTLLISECCLIYLAPSQADAVLEYFTKFFSVGVPLAMVIYEPIRPDDAFGRTMVSNLTARGIHLQTLEKYASLSAQRARLKRHGFDHLPEEVGFSSVSGGSEAADIDFIWRQWTSLDAAEIERVEGLEWLDEVEEFTLFARHYCVAWGWRAFSKDKRWTGSLPRQTDA